MSAGDHGVRPSVPHAMTRVRTDRASAVPPIDEQETVRENVDPALAELLALIKDPSGMSIETVLKLLITGQRHATADTRAKDKLGVDLGVGQVREDFKSVRESIIGRRRIREWIMIVALVLSVATAAGQAVWNLVAPKAREAAEVAVIAPAIEAKRVATAAVETADDHEARITKMEATQAEILGAIEKLNGAVVMVIDRLPEPPPRVIEVPAHTAPPRRGGKKAGLDE